MARMVALWLCTCGTCIKVIAEVDCSPPARQTVSCPRCHTPKAITADRIVTITEDTPEHHPAPTRCEEKERLLVAQNKAFHIYRRLTGELTEAAGMIAHAEFQFLYDKVLTARQFLAETRQHLIEHTATHGC